jgi:G3E family GTPase
VKRARYIMVGGFLGAGKTTALLRLAEVLKAEGQKVGLITNDQSVGLVDTTMLAAHDFPVEEITGGCFCCRFNSLTDAAEKLSEIDRPDVFLAEPVGSCTDLTATVSYPLRRIYGDAFSIAPYTVLLDPVRAERILGLAEGKNFSPKVIYIYQKQLEEADIIVINKMDSLSDERLQELRTTLVILYPEAKILALSARTGEGFADWVDAIRDTEMPAGESMDVNYDTYAEGEALLGWVNATVNLEAVDEFDGNDYLQTLATAIHHKLRTAGCEIAHLKMTLSPDTGNDLGVVNLVRNDDVPEASHRLQAPLEAGECIVNLRAEGDPQVLKAVVLEALQSGPVTATIQHLEAFRPGRPVPTHRLMQG